MLLTSVLPFSVQQAQQLDQLKHMREHLDEEIKKEEEMIKQHQVGRGGVVVGKGIKQHQVGRGLGGEGLSLVQLEHLKHLREHFLEEMETEDQTASARGVS